MTELRRRSSPFVFPPEPEAVAREIEGGGIDGGARRREIWRRVRRRGGSGCSHPQARIPPRHRAAGLSPPKQRRSGSCLSACLLISILLPFRSQIWIPALFCRLCFRLSRPGPDLGSPRLSRQVASGFAQGIKVRWLASRTWGSSMFSVKVFRQFTNPRSQVSWIEYPNCVLKPSYLFPLYPLLHQQSTPTLINM